MDSLHEVDDVPFKQAQRLFAAEGCHVFGENHSVNENKAAAAVSAAMFELLGDDIDGIAAMTEDFDYLFE